MIQLLKTINASLGPTPNHLSDVIQIDGGFNMRHFLHFLRISFWCVFLVRVDAAEPMDLGAAFPQQVLHQASQQQEAGLAVFAGIANPGEAITLAESGRWLVHVTDTDLTAINAAREAIHQARLTGLASAEHYATLTTLPYRQHALTLLVLDADALAPRAPSVSEVQRVLTPEYGVALVRRNGQWQQITKTWPKGFGDWTHVYGMANGNLFSEDTVADLPNGLQWLGEGGVGQNNSTLVSKGVIVMGDRAPNQTSGKRIHKALTHRPPEEQKAAVKKWQYGLPLRFGNQAHTGYSFLVRDAFNGVPRYRIPGKKETPRLIIGDTFITSVFTDEAMQKHPRERKEYMMASFNLRTGQLIQRFTEGLKANQTQRARAVGFSTKKEKGHNMFAAAHGKLLIQAAGNQVVGLDVETGRRLWTYTSPEAHTYAVAISENGKDIYFSEGSEMMQRVRFYGARNAVNIVRLEAATGQVVWKALVPEVLARKSSREKNNQVPFREISQIIPIVKEDMVFICASDHHSWASHLAYVGALRMQDGSLAWLRGANRIKNEGKSMVTRRKEGMTKEELEAYFRDNQEGLIAATKIDDKDASNMAMLYRNGLIEYHGSYTIFLYDAQTGFMSHRTQDNMGCQRSAATPNLTYIASYAFADTVSHGEVSYREIGFQHPHCGDGFVPSHGMWFTESSEKCSCVQHIWTQFAMTTQPVPDLIPEEHRLQPAKAFPGRDQQPRGDILAIEQDRQSPILATWDRGYYGPVTARDAIFHDDHGWGEAIQIGDWVYKADLHGHRMVGFRNGTAVWSIQVGGRIPGQPVLHDGRLYFSSRDGYVYAVNAETGDTHWRFLAARNHHKIYLSGQLESLWPATNVELFEGNIAVAAGIHNQADGGLLIWGLDPASGSVAWRSSVYTGPSANKDGNHRHGHGGRNRRLSSLALHRLDIVNGKLGIQFEHKQGFGPQAPDGMSSVWIDPDSDNRQVVDLSKRWTTYPMPYANLPWLNRTDVLRNQAQRSGSRMQMTDEELREAIAAGIKVPEIGLPKKKKGAYYEKVQAFNTRLKRIKADGVK